MPAAFRSFLMTAVGAAFITVPSSIRAQVLLVTSSLAEKEASPGETYMGRIVIANPTGFPQAVRIYQVDSGAVSRSNAKWVVPQMQQLIVPAHSEAAVPYTVRVPPDDSLRGTYWSQIVIAGTQPLSVHVATHVATTATRTVDFEKPSAGHDSTGSATLDLDVLATGERGVRLRLTAEVYDSTGALKARAAHTRDLLFPGSSLRQHFDFDRLPTGTYRVMVFADPGAGQVFAGQFTIVF